jgi:hypothetical protein
MFQSAAVYCVMRQVLWLTGAFAIKSGTHSKWGDYVSEISVATN